MYLVGTSASRILIDAGEGKADDLPVLLSAMAEDGAERLSDVLITHYHRDHTEGIRELRAHFGDALRIWKMPWAPNVLVPWTKVEHGPSFDLRTMGVRMLADGDVLRTEAGDAALRVVATPGHTVDHCCFALTEEGSLFSGDHILGGSSGVFEDLHSYMQSLDKTLAALPAGGGGRIYPAHGPVIEDGHQGVLSYISNRRMRESQVVEALQSTRSLTPFGIARRIYPQVHECMHRTHAAVIAGAVRRALTHLACLRLVVRVPPIPTDFACACAALTLSTHQSTAMSRQVNMTYHWLTAPYSCPYAALVCPSAGGGFQRGEDAAQVAEGGASNGTRALAVPNQPVRRQH